MSERAPHATQGINANDAAGGITLLSCPFCGGHAEHDTDDLGCHGVRCIDCSIYLGAYSTRKRAAQVWNHRSPDLLPPLTASISIVRERDAYRADAMRYRWLRMCAARIDHDFFRLAFQWRVPQGYHDSIPTDAQIDAAIDAFMAEEKS